MYRFMLGSFDLMYPQCYVLNMKCTDDLIVEAFMKGYGVMYGNRSKNDQGAVQDILEGRPVFLVQEGRLVNGSVEEVANFDIGH